MYKRDYTFRMNVMEEIFEIRSCIEIIWETVFTCQKTQPTDDYKEFVLGELTELWDNYY